MEEIILRLNPKSRNMFKGERLKRKKDNYLFAINAMN
jgi:hypothetical protein